MKDAQIAELLLQALETEIGGTQVYMTAVKCATNEDLKEEFNKYLEQTEHHVEVVEALLTEFGLDPKATSPGREVVHHIGSSLVVAMETALAEGPPEAAQLVAAECVTLAETKDHLNWELIGEVADHMKGERAKTVEGRVCGGRRARGRAPLPQHRLGPGTVDRVARPAGRPASTGRKKGRKDGHRCRPGQAEPGTISQGLGRRNSLTYQAS